MLSVVAALTADCMYVTMWCWQVVRNYVPRTLYPGTSKTMYPVLSKPCTMCPKHETMYPVDPKPCTPYSPNHVPSTSKYVRIPCVNLGIESENNIYFCSKFEGLEILST